MSAFAAASAAWARVYRAFWLARLPAAPLRLVQRGYGLLVLWYLWGNRWQLAVYFGPSRTLERSGIFDKISSLALSLVAPYDSWATAKALYALTAVAALCLVSGYFVLPAAVACFLLVSTWVNLGQLSAGSGGGDLILRALGWPLVAAAAAGHLGRRIAAIPAWPLRLFQIQATLIYWTQGTARLELASWRDGRALCQIASESELVRLSSDAWCGTVGAVLTRALPSVEVCLAVLLWVAPWRARLIAAAATLHILAASMFRTPLYNEAMLVLLAAFLPLTAARVGAPARLPTTESGL